jgi:hypothetical protein
MSPHFFFQKAFRRLTIREAFEYVPPMSRNVSRYLKTESNGNPIMKFYNSFLLKPFILAIFTAYLISGTLIAEEVQTPGTSSAAEAAEFGSSIAEMGDDVVPEPENEVIDPVLTLLATSDAEPLSEENRVLLLQRHDEIRSSLPEFQKRLQDVAANETDPGKRKITEDTIRAEARLAIQQRLRIQRRLTASHSADAPPVVLP